LDEAARTSDPEIRLKLLQDVELRAIDDAPWVFLYHPVSYELVQPRVRDFRLHPLRPARFERVWLADTP
jgi:ABC-type transport system substrate-binding protein